MNDKIITYLVTRIKQDFSNFIYFADEDCFYYQNTSTGLWQIDHSQRILTETISTQLPLLLFNEFQEMIPKDENLYIKTVLAIRNKIDLVSNWLKNLDNVFILINKLKTLKKITLEK